jgi:hypothetical protein
LKASWSKGPSHGLFAVGHDDRQVLRAAVRARHTHDRASAWRGVAVLDNQDGFAVVREDVAVRLVGAGGDELRAVVARDGLDCDGRPWHEASKKQKSKDNNCRRLQSGAVFV